MLHICTCEEEQLRTRTFPVDFYFFATVDFCVLQIKQTCQHFVLTHYPNLNSSSVGLVYVYHCEDEKGNTDGGDGSRIYLNPLLQASISRNVQIKGPFFHILSCFFAFVWDVNVSVGIPRHH